jgi:hypothetical protein
MLLDPMERIAASIFENFRRNFFFIICKIFRYGIFYQKLKSASDREFYSAIRCFTSIYKTRILMKPENRIF